MKAAIITDIHFGAGGDSVIFLDSLEKFFKEDFFPYLDQNGIKVVFNLGDTFDKRVMIKYATFVRSKEMFFDEIERRGIEYHTIIGNHDTVYKEKNYPNSVQQLIQPRYPKFHIYTEPKLLEIGNSAIQWIPWIPVDAEVERKYMGVIENSNADILFGHFTINGFLMQKGRASDHGIDHKTLSKFELVGSGHFHHRSTRENIWYFGSPSQQSWNDYGNAKGFHIIDLDTRDIEFIPNRHDVYHAFDYSDDALPDLTEVPIEGSIFKINIVKKESQTKFDAFMTQLEAGNPHKINIIDARDYGADEELQIEEAKDTKKIMEEFVDVLDLADEKKSEMKEFFDELYREALSVKL